jgi:hypothetical protein
MIAILAGDSTAEAHAALTQLAHLTTHPTARPALIAGGLVHSLLHTLSAPDVDVALSRLGAFMLAQLAHDPAADGVFDAEASLKALIDVCARAASDDAVLASTSAVLLQLCVAKPARWEAVGRLGGARLCMSFLRSQPDADVQQRCVAQLTAQAGASSAALQELIDLGAVGALARNVHSCKADGHARGALRLLAALTDLPAGLDHAAHDPLFLKAIFGALVKFAQADTRRTCLQCAAKVAAAIESIPSDAVDAECLRTLVAYVSTDGLDALLAAAIVYKARHPICAGTGAHSAHICAGTGLTPPTSAPGPATPIGL